MNVGVARTIITLGFAAHCITVEAALLPGLPGFTIVGLPDTAVNESRERIRGAFLAAGITFPNRRVSVNLSPAHLPKGGSGLDLAIAAAIFSASTGKQMPGIFLGELGLDGTVRPVRGVLAAALHWRGSAEHFFVPAGQEREVEEVGLKASTIWHISQIARMAGAGEGVTVPQRPPREEKEEGAAPREIDIADVLGHEEAKLALEIAASGGHHLFMIGPPGVGKTMLAERLPTLLPPLERDASLEVAALRSTVEASVEISDIPPFVAPHHSSSVASLVGGGPRPRIGAISQAHHGVLFLDELPEFSRPALQALREPMESGSIHIYRAKADLVFPARFQLIAAANPCPCGRFLDADHSCRCSPHMRATYIKKIGGPLVDRCDIALKVLRPLAPLGGVSGERSAVIRARVLEARERQRQRYAECEWAVNANVPGQYLRKAMPVSTRCQALLEEAFSKNGMSLRALDKALRCAWTLADVAGKAEPTRDDLASALYFKAGFDEFTA